TARKAVVAAPAGMPVRPAEPAARKAAADGPPAWLDEAPDVFEHQVVREPAPAPARPAAREPAPLQATPLGERWAAIVAMLEERQLITALARELALQAELIEQHDGAAPVWRLRVERESLRTTALRDKLQSALAEGLGIAPLRLELDAGTPNDTPAKRMNAEKQRRQQEAEQVIHNDPLVQDMLAQFKTARIVPGSIKPH
ncbi:MAG: DNA polymerase III subunit gamma/tau C-terminal domain-containing protein, partial [Burkholderiaceae bacterium]